MIRRIQENLRAMEVEYPDYKKPTAKDILSRVPVRKSIDHDKYVKPNSNDTV